MYILKIISIYVSSILFSLAYATSNVSQQNVHNIQSQGLPQSYDDTFLVPKQQPSFKVETIKNPSNLNYRDQHTPASMYIIQAQTAKIDKLNSQYIIKIKRSDLYHIMKFKFKSKTLIIAGSDILNSLISKNGNNKFKGDSGVISAGNLKAQLIFLSDIKTEKDIVEIIISKNNYGSLNADNILGMFHDFLLIVYK